MANSLYDRLGGFGAISSVVIRFYELILADESLEKYFYGVNMERLMDHQTRFLCGVMGGPHSYNGQDIKKAHAHLKISNEAFESVASHLVKALKDHDIGESDIQVIGDIVSSIKVNIVTV